MGPAEVKAISIVHGGAGKLEAFRQTMSLLDEWQRRNRRPILMSA